MMVRRMGWWLPIVLGSALGVVCAGVAGTPPSEASAAASAASIAPPQKHLDRTGKTRRGEASYYGGKFEGKEMANGQHMDADADAAASKTLPLGTTARVTNLDTGKSDVVVIKDRGPYVGGRIVDVTPKVADKLDMKKDGVAPVKVQPLKLPPKDASAPPSK